MARVARCSCGWHKSFAEFYADKRVRCADCGNVVDVHEASVPYGYPPYATWAGNPAPNPDAGQVAVPGAPVNPSSPRRAGMRRLSAAWLLALTNLLVVPHLRGGPSLVLVIGFGVLALFLLREAASNLGRHGGVRFSWLVLPVIGLLLPVLMALQAVPHTRGCGAFRTPRESVKVVAEPQERVWRFREGAESERAMQYRYRHERGRRAEPPTGNVEPAAVGSRAGGFHASQCFPAVSDPDGLRQRQTAAGRSAAADGHDSGLDAGRAIQSRDGPEARGTCPGR